MQIRIDHNIKGDAELLFALLVKDGWADLLELQFVDFSETPLQVTSDDTTIWRYPQTHGMLLLTYNRNDEDETSLSATIRRANTPVALPVMTVANPLRLKELGYRRAVAERMAEILVYLENYLGAGRLFIP